MSETSPSSRSERVPFARPVHVTPLDASGQPMRLVGGNLSRTGMFLRSQLLLPAGTRVSLAFEAKGQTLPFAEAEVVWQRAPSADGGTSGFALRFSRFLNPKGPELVEQLVTLGRSKLAEAEAKLARDTSPAHAEPPEEPRAPAAAAPAVRPPPTPADATPPEELPAIRMSGQKPSFATGTGPASIGVPRPATLGGTGAEASPDEVTLGELDVETPPSSLRGSKVKGPSAGALALLVGVPLVIA
ncbi:MAG: PilZ domain-containing protein, partial [Deltaproteobacteria bacterium]|nr:PilZ domain-containing protein [Deltaproteobacteria bacterium]